MVAFLLAIIWWIALTLYEGERDVIERFGIDFWSVMSTVGLVFAAALVGAIMGRNSSTSDAS